MLEAGSKIQKLTMKEIGTDNVIAEGGKSSILVHVESASEFSVFCLFAVRKEDCIIDSSGQMRVCLSEKRSKLLYLIFQMLIRLQLLKSRKNFLVI